MKENQDMGWALGGVQKPPDSSRICCPVVAASLPCAWGRSPSETSWKLLSFGIGESNCWVWTSFPKMSCCDTVLPGARPQWCLPGCPSPTVELVCPLVIPILPGVLRVIGADDIAVRAFFQLNGVISFCSSTKYIYIMSCKGRLATRIGNSLSHRQMVRFVEAGPGGGHTTRKVPSSGSNRHSQYSWPKPLRTSYYALIKSTIPRLETLSKEMFQETGYSLNE